MLRSKVNFSWVFALIALLGYVFISFMGLTYTQIVPLGLSALISLVFAAVVIFLVSIMCKAKATRWLRLGMIGQVSIGFIVLILLLVSSIFFTHFTKMIKEQETIVSTYTRTIDDARKLDEKYRAYVDDRCADYQAKIQNLKAGSSDYKKMIAKPSQLGYTKAQIARKYSETMKNFLLGDNMDELNEKRTQWLSQDTTTVWNINLPNNIQDVTSSVNQWLKNYEELSSKQYTLETSVEAFKDQEFNKNAESLQEICTTVTTPSLTSILLALLCFVFIILPWLVTPKNIASIGDDNNYIVEMPDEE